MERLQKVSRVIVVGPPIEFTAEVPPLIGRWRGHRDPTRYLMTFARADKIADSATLHAFARARKIDFVDWTQIFCGAGQHCPASDGKGTLYISDVAHLTYPGAQYLGNRLRAEGALDLILEPNRAETMPISR